MRKSKKVEICQLCKRNNEKLNLVNLHYFKARICDSCLKWYSTLLYNTVRRMDHILTGGAIDFE